MSTGACFRASENGQGLVLLLTFNMSIYHDKENFRFRVLGAYSKKIKYGMVRVGNTLMNDFKV